MTNTTSCAICKKTITCTPKYVQTCDCNKINISPKTQYFLYNAQAPCFCNTCLQSLDAQILALDSLQLPTKKEHFVEGVHYYTEGKNWVFTALYHLLRGHCCQSNCRHCAYGYCKNQ